MLKKTNIYNRLIAFITKKGKKTKSHKIVFKAFIVSTKKLKKTFFEIYYMFFKFFLENYVFVEPRQVSIKYQTHVVPMLISNNRKIYLILKGIYSVIIKNTKHLSFALKLGLEIYLILIKSNFSKCLKLKDYNNSEVISNKSKIHYRW